MTTWVAHAFRTRIQVLTDDANSLFVFYTHSPFQCVLRTSIQTCSTHGACTDARCMYRFIVIQSAAYDLWILSIEETAYEE